ncbi:MAG: NusG domain II-containing protein [Alkaliphilus sp.]|nr:NusG domain II-containing protein [Alkaliphilus sp.]
MTKWDKFLIIFMILAALGGFVLVKSITSREGQVYLVIEIEGKEYKKISLAQPVSEKKIVIDTLLGHNIIGIYEDGVKIDEADCRDQLCVKMGKITKANQINICLPNRVSIKLISDESDLDIISY